MSEQISTQSIILCIDRMKSLIDHLDPDHIINITKNEEVINELCKINNCTREDLVGDYTTRQWGTEKIELLNHTRDQVWARVAEMRSNDKYNRTQHDSLDYIRNMTSFITSEATQSLHMLGNKMGTNIKLKKQLEENKKIIASLNADVQNNYNLGMDNEYKNRIQTKVIKDQKEIIATLTQSTSDERLKESETSYSEMVTQMGDMLHKHDLEVSKLKKNFDLTTTELRNDYDKSVMKYARSMNSSLVTSIEALTSQNKELSSDYETLEETNENLESQNNELTELYEELKDRHDGILDEVNEAGNLREQLRILNESCKDFMDQNSNYAYQLKMLKARLKDKNTDSMVIRIREDRDKIREQKTLITKLVNDNRKQALEFCDVTGKQEIRMSELVRDNDTLTTRWLNLHNICPSPPKLVRSPEIEDNVDFDEWCDVLLDNL
jgi:chromosome segregation ATPase